jgi:Transcriptional regulators
MAGVSKATVSRVLNHNSSVNPATNERVMRVIEEHDFVPNASAIGLAGGKTRLVGVLAPPLAWPALPEMLRGVAAYIEETSYEIILYSINFERNHSDVLDRILSMSLASGLLAILPGELSHHLTKRFHNGLPMVIIDDQEKLDDIPWVGIDNVASAYSATKHLLDLGHRRIAYIQGPAHYYCCVKRYQGYTEALQEAGIAPDPALIFQGRFDAPSGRECALALFSQPRSDWPTAIFASNDQMAYGVLEIAEQQGIRIPEDIALVGFDDNPLSEHMHPPLTTISQPFFQMGYRAMELLLTMVDPHHRTNERTPEKKLFADLPVTELMRTKDPVQIQLQSNLVVRASSTTTQARSPSL